MATVGIDEPAAIDGAETTGTFLGGVDITGTKDLATVLLSAPKLLSAETGEISPPSMEGVLISKGKRVRPVAKEIKIPCIRNFKLIFSSIR